jgi:hypothetical protein
MRNFILPLIAVAALLVQGNIASAASFSFTLNHDDASFTVDNTGLFLKGTAFDTGNGLNQLNPLSGQAFYRQAGNAPSESELGAADTTSMGSGALGNIGSTISVLYTSQQLFDLTVDYTLTDDNGAGDPTAATLTQTFTFTAKNTFADVPMSFFPYVDLDLDQTASNDRSPSGDDGMLNFVDTVTGTTGSFSTAPDADAFEVAFAAVLSGKLTDGTDDNLTPNAFPFPPGVGTSADIAGAFQYDFLLPQVTGTPGQFSFTTQLSVISEQQPVNPSVPEPSSGLLCFVALSLFWKITYAARRTRC